jgi:hypothetical protein
MDEVGLPFVFDAKMTYEEIGMDRVCVAEPGDGAWSKRQATAICCINPLLPPHLQPPVALIFKGKASASPRNSQTFIWMSPLACAPDLSHMMTACVLLPIGQTQRLS